MWESLVVKHVLICFGICASTACSLPGFSAKIDAGTCTGDTLAHGQSCTVRCDASAADPSVGGPSEFTYTCNDPLGLGHISPPTSDPEATCIESMLPILSNCLFVDLLANAYLVSFFEHAECPPIDLTSSLYIEGTCTDGLRLKYGGFCDVRCRPGYTATSSSLQYTCAAGGSTFLQQPTASCEPGT